MKAIVDAQQLSEKLKNCLNAPTQNLYFGQSC